MIKTRNFGAANELQVISDASNDRQMVKFNSAPHAGSRIASADISLSPLRGKCLPKAGKRGCQGLKKGFTLAEVLITLVVIGIVAAITIPVLHSNTNGKEFIAAKQKARASLGEAFKLMTIDGPLEEYPNGGADVVKQVLPKYIKMAKTCDTASECGFADTMKKTDGTTFKSTDLKGWNSWWNGRWNKPYVWKDGKFEEMALSDDGIFKAGFFQTLDGFSIALFYNPNCSADEYDTPGHFGLSSSDDGYRNLSIFSTMCFNAVYDMNGKKGPNQAGKDIGFIGSFYYGVSAESGAALPASSKWKLKVNYYMAENHCSSLGKEYVIPELNELRLINLNNRAVGFPYNWVWTRTSYPDYKYQPAVYITAGNGNFSVGAKGGGLGKQQYAVMCVQKEH